MTEFTEQVVSLIRAVPVGNVCTYGGIASLAGSPKSARQVARILHSMSRSHDLPWHRIVNGKGKIALSDPDGFKRQRNRLREEGVEVDEAGGIDLKRFLWTG